MGMYNTIDVKKNCPKCGAQVEWQSKDLEIDGKYPVMNVLETYKLNNKMVGEVHTLCDKCKTWSEFKIEKGKLSSINL